jgi:hypothetical protein
MRALVALLIAVVLVLAAYRYYFTRSQPAGSGTVPTQAISITGVKNDLVAIAQAERVYFSSRGSYAALDELISTGALKLAKPERDGYSYSVEVTSNGFIATAQYRGPAGLHYPTLTIDQTMQIRQQE